MSALFVQLDNTVRVEAMWALSDVLLARIVKLAVIRPQRVRLGRSVIQLR